MLSGKNTSKDKIVKSVLYIAIALLLSYVSPKLQQLDNKLIVMFASSASMIIICACAILLIKCWDDSTESEDPNKGL